MKSRPKNDFSAVSQESQPIRKNDGATSACPASLGKNSLFFPRAAAVVARADHMPEVEPSPGSAPGGEARAAQVARELLVSPVNGGPRGVGAQCRGWRRLEHANKRHCLRGARARALLQK